MHTSVVTIAVLEDERPSRLAAAPDQVRVERMRGRGRGGQRKNKVETAVRVRHEPTGLTVTRTAGRSQSANLSSARAQLGRELLAMAETAARSERNSQRRRQVARAAQARVFTHSAKRGQVTDSLTGRSWHLRAWRQGRLGEGGS